MRYSAALNPPLEPDVHRLRLHYLPIGRLLCGGADGRNYIIMAQQKGCGGFRKGEGRTMCLFRFLEPGGYRFILHALACSQVQGAIRVSVAPETAAYVRYLRESARVSSAPPGRGAMRAHMVERALLPDKHQQYVVGIEFDVLQQEPAGSRVVADLPRDLVECARNGLDRYPLPCCGGRDGLWHRGRWLIVRGVLRQFIKQLSTIWTSLTAPV